ncbi:putative OPA3-like protein CG13603 isoform X2 [Portunus trituberculatus]|uniref:putative OPA3-like protein CG13603 isoform X2 n=1 Tax=Portunus trituberculatus TaxID=210409 RepID=UPI001E1D1E27|nr:putative OPA3-like protein CG13603 isoform X2 [Portunus trituberculatus]
MAPVFPLAKLAFLFVKQVARPLSSSIRRRAVRSVFFRENICLPPARFYHWCEVRLKMYVMNIGRSGQKTTIPKLSEEAAIELGGNLLGEGVIFSIAVVILAFEVSRQKEKEKKKEEAERAFIDSLENRINELTFATEELDTKLREVTRIAYAMQHQAKTQQVKTNRTSEARDTGVDSPSQHDASETDRLFGNRTDMGALHEALSYVMERIMNRTVQ